MADNITPIQQFLLEEYKSAVDLTNHFDELRNKTTNFYLTFAGVAATGGVILAKGELKLHLLGDNDLPIAILLLLVAVLGVAVVGNLARLRKAQLRQFGIITNIRAQFIGNDYDLWNTVQSSRRHLPTLRRTSGTYMWVLMVFTISSSLFGFSVGMLTAKTLTMLLPASCPFIPWISVPVGVLTMLVAFNSEDQLYFNWAKPRKDSVYSADNDPLTPEQSGDLPPSFWSMLTSKVRGKSQAPGQRADRP